MDKVIQVSQDEPDARVVARAAEILVAGGVLVMPTDSVYGLGCAATVGNPGHRRIFEIKHRDPRQTLPWLVASRCDLARYGRDVPQWALTMAEAFWPGALTLVVRASDEVPEEYRRAGEGTIALRLPASRLVQELSLRAGVPLATTSANTHGRDAATSGAGVEERIVTEADLTLDAGPAPIAVASTIVGCTGPRPEFLRVGAIPPEELLGVLERS